METYLNPESVKHLPSSHIFWQSLLESMKSETLSITVSTIYHFEKKYKIDGYKIDIFEKIFHELKLEVERRLRNRFNRFMLSKYYSQYACNVSTQVSLVSLGFK